MFRSLDAEYIGLVFAGGDETVTDEHFGELSAAIDDELSVACDDEHADGLRAACSDTGVME